MATDTTKQPADRPRLIAPWSQDVVDALNHYQKSDSFHAYTCGTKEKHASSDGEHPLLATTDGWICQSCGYRQIWAHAGSAEIGKWEALKSIRFSHTKFGDLAMGETFFYYDEPLVFSVTDKIAGTWLVTAIASDDEGRNSDWALCRLQTGELEGIRAAVAETGQLVDLFRRIMHRGAWCLREYWDQPERNETTEMSRSEILAMMP